MRLSLLIIVLALLFSNCRQKNNYEELTSVLDSTKIVLQVKLNELKKAETNMQANSFTKFDAYHNFLNSNLKDTIDKAYANPLRNFINSGKVVKNFNTLKPQLIKETETTISQLQKLSSDLKGNALPFNTAKTYFSNEISHCNILIPTIEGDIKALNIALINFRNSVPKTEELIKKINNGQLPSIVEAAD
jgi:hypothetical protein